ncbi:MULTISPECIES: hypothetical protein [unclassified Streptomyces]|uniref:hypothetical protein n=1 Tax=unclassified Streptomyces TaxID=2593676 RepID=UPI0008238715|nr:MULTISPECIES: hypothetical protein [unclassified Streptomyces]SCK49317.1 hypothetical protein YW7DRAFT_04428 [Streptomyces sp. AmelKG-E11A]
MPPAPTPSTPALGGSRWNTFPGAGTTLTAREFFTATEPLLQGIIDDNALTSADSEVLEDQIRAALALGTRETSLPLSLGPDSAPAARELGAQAETIGQELASWSTEALERLLTDPVPLPAGPLVVRSHCYGHLLTPPAADLLRGRRGGPVTMQLYNEWLHQMILLRDALLAFTNWQDVPLLITPTGLRHTEPARDAFLTELLVRQIRHTSIVVFARNVVTGTSGPAGYGFEAGGGTALPAVLDQPPLTAPRHLLTWRPDPAAGEAATYVPSVRDYYAAPRTLVEDLPPATTASGPLSARTVTAPFADGTRTARIEVTHDGTTTHVDLGQALRGHRFIQREDPAAGDASGTADAWSALRAPGLVWTQSGDVTLDATGQDDLVVLALLGRLYPENVTLRPVGRSAARTTADGTGPSRLVTLVDPARAH